MAPYISIISALLAGLALWLIFSVKKAKKRERYTKDEDRKSFWDSNNMMEHLKDKPPPPEAPEPEKVQAKKRVKKKRKSPPKKKEESKGFDLEQAIIASEIIKRKEKPKKD